MPLKYMNEVLTTLFLLTSPTILEHEVEEKVVEVEKVVEPSYIEVEATFYTAFCDTGCIGVTKSGHDVRNTIYYEGKRILAADKSIPLYTEYLVELENGESFEAIVLDRGGAIIFPVFDILVSSKEEAYKLGRQKAKITLLEE